jgi:transmembrane sensor
MDNNNPIEEAHLLILLQGYVRDDLNVDEKNELQSWADLKPENQRLLEKFKDEEFLHAAMQQYSGYSIEAALQKAKSRIGTTKPSSSMTVFSRISWQKYVVAAMILLTLSIGVALMQGKRIQETAQSSFKQDVDPGGNHASITLADGRTIELSDDKEGVVIENGKLTYTDGVEVAMGQTGSLYSTITTPIGGQYQVVLSDGTKVWLNAASSIKYPSKFSKDERRVELTGEAYFEVSQIKSVPSSNKKIPFIIKTTNQEVEVLGTHFNINAYLDEHSTRTTLLEGSVRVFYGRNASVLLKPNQQSIITPGSTPAIVNSIDPSSAIAWKNGIFNFQDKTLDEVMRQLARWYNLEIVYEGAVPQMEFFGKIRRNNKLSEVLHILESAGIHFRVENERRLIISSDF